LSKMCSVFRLTSYGQNKNIRAGIVAAGRGERPSFGVLVMAARATKDG